MFIFTDIDVVAYPKNLSRLRVKKSRLSVSFRSLIWVNIRRWETNKIICKWVLFLSCNQNIFYRSV